MSAGEVEIVPVPRADDRVAVDPALDERSVLVRAGGTAGDEPPAAGVEPRDRQPAVRAPAAHTAAAATPALDERSVLVRAGGTAGDDPPAAGVEQRDRQAAVLD